MRFDILTLFPQAVTPYLEQSIMGRAQEAGHVQVKTWDIRSFASDTHKTVDDTPYGGGAGMVMKVEPIDKALQAIFEDSGQLQRKVVVLSAKGKQFSQSVATDYSSLEQLILICGRYEGIDQRVADFLADEELSIGPYVLAGGEIGALAVIEATSRLVPGVLGNPVSLEEESHNEQGFAEYPQYTKPETYKDWSVPSVLLSGNHSEIEKWRGNQ